MTKRQITITECDRCGKEDKAEFGSIKLLSYPGAPSYDHFDLCRLCQEHFKRFMRKEDPEARRFNMYRKDERNAY